jgi:hypothetical protein
METFIKPNKKEKNGNRYFLSDLFNNVYIKEALPLAKKN